MITSYQKKTDKIVKGFELYYQNSDLSNFQMKKKKSLFKLFLQSGNSTGICADDILSL